MSLAFADGMHSLYQPISRETAMNRTDPGNEPAPSMRTTADRQSKRPPGRDADSPESGLASIEVKLDSLRTDLAAEIRSLRKDVGSLEN
ncbi:MAG: hypothetical protein OYG32_14695 [Rhodospirillaceae bacterium]|nr:hypothetical protein [Rhodospirillaceae bacterium]